jgi:uncharacterized protein YcgL (UPF0745 family)
MARQDPLVVLKNLSADGYHIQLPPAPFSKNMDVPSAGHDMADARPLGGVS